MTNDKMISHYQIIGEAGRGGMATVYLAQDTRIDRQVAIKVLPAYFVHDPQFRTRFQQEAQTVVKFSHPHIVPVYEFGVESDEPYLVMAYMPGGTLADRIAKGPIPLDEAIDILTPIASALDYAHAKGVVHRDLKPGNILFDDSGAAQLTDFGVVKLAEATQSFTGSAIIGTPAYMSPEQVKGDKHIDGRSDFYGLAVILYEMLTGEVPYKGDTPTQQLMKHVLEPAPRVRAVRPDFPAEVEAVLLTALAKEPEQRYPTGRAFIAALANPLAARGPQTFITAPAAAAAAPAPAPAQPPPAARPPAPPSAPPPQTEIYHINYEPLPAMTGGRRGSSGRNLGFAALVAILLLMAGGGAAAFFLRDAPPEPTPIVEEPPPTDTPPPTVDQDGTRRAVEIAVQQTLEAAGETADATLTAIAAREEETSLEATARAEAQATVFAIATTEARATLAAAQARDAEATRRARATREAADRLTRQAVPTVTPTPRRSTNTGSTASSGGGLPLSFDAFGGWVRGDEANGEFSRSTAQAHSGGASGRLDYDFSSSSNDYVVFLQENAIDGAPNALQIWVYGDGAGHYLNAWIRDNDGQTWQVPFGRVTHSGWKQMTGYIDTDQSWPWAIISGGSDDTVDYPIKFRGFVLDDSNDAYVGSGAIYLDDLTTATLQGGSPGSSTTTTGPTVTPAPASNPSGDVIDCKYIGGGNFEWHTGQGGPFTGTWQSGCPASPSVRFNGCRVEWVAGNNSVVQGVVVLRKTGTVNGSAYSQVDEFPAPPPEGSQQITLPSNFSGEVVASYDLVLDSGRSESTRAQRAFRNECTATSP